MFGLRLRELRKSKKFTQSQIAKMIGVNQNTYSYWEKERNEPDIISLIKLADIYKISLDYLMCRYELQEIIYKKAE